MRIHVSLLPLCLVLSSCVTTSLKNLEVAAPPARHPVRITENQKPSRVTLRSYLSSNKEKWFRTRIDSNSPYRNADPADNLLWHIPELQAGFDLEFTFSKSGVLLIGVSISEIQDKIHWSPKVGIGFYKESSIMGQRIDLVLESTRSRYDAELRQTFIQWSYGLTKHGGKNYVNPAIIYSLNTRGSHFPIDFFANVAAGGQTLYKHVDFCALQLYYSFSAGLFKTVGRNVRFIAGTRITRFEEDHRSELTMPDLFVQTDIIIN